MLGSGRLPGLHTFIANGEGDGGFRRPALTVTVAPSHPAQLIPQGSDVVHLSVIYRTTVAVTPRHPAQLIPQGSDVVHLSVIYRTTVAVTPRHPA